MTPEERKKITLKLREEHNPYFSIIRTINGYVEDPLYIPKMAYRPPGKDELHITFFPSELEKEKDIYTEFVSIEYESEDPKRTLYLMSHNHKWKKDYELITSSSGFKRHMVPVSSLKVINDVVSRNQDKQTAIEEGLDHKGEFDSIIDPDERNIVDVLKGIEKALLSINKKIK